MAIGYKTLFRIAMSVTLCAIFGLTPWGHATIDDCTPPQCPPRHYQEQTGRYDVAASSLQFVNSETQDAPESVNPLPLPAQRQLLHAKALHRRAVNGEAEACKQAVTLLTQLAQEYPTHATIRVYLGSVRLLEARSTWSLWRKYHLSREGLQFLDTAVAQAPNDLEVRFICGVTTYHLPHAGKRSEQAAADLQWVAMRASAAVTHGRLDHALATAALYYHGLCREARADFMGAHAAWREAHALAPTSLSGRYAARRLQDTPLVGGSESFLKR
jgi:hypothetical protein